MSALEKLLAFTVQLSLLILMILVISLRLDIPSDETLGDLAVHRSHLRAWLKTPMSAPSQMARESTTSAESTSTPFNATQPESVPNQSVQTSP